jgi:hypothetical protein
VLAVRRPDVSGRMQRNAPIRTFYERVNSYYRKHFHNTAAGEAV